MKIIETTNGDILFDNTNSLNYKCSTENGNITGTIKGVETDYLIVTKTVNGKSNIKNNVIESTSIIEFNVKNGDVNIEFSE